MSKKDLPLFPSFFFFVYFCTWLISEADVLCEDNKTSDVGKKIMKM